MTETLARQAARPAAPQRWLARLDPRVKVAGFVLLIIAASVTHHLLALGLVFGCAAAAALASGIGLRRVSGIWIGVPLFSLVMILPATLNIITDGPALIILGRPGAGARLGPWALPEVISVTRPGLVLAARFVLRVTDCATLALLLVATTESGALLGALRGLGMPRAFGMVLSMMQRYLWVLLRAAEQLHLAKLSRTIGPTSLRAEQQWVAAGIAALFRRTRHLAQAVFHAMLARGYDGDLQVRPWGRLRLRDALWLAGAASCAAALVFCDRLL